MRPTSFLTFLVAVFAAAILSGCGTSGYLNENYPFSNRPASFELAVAPSVAEGSLAVHTDTIAANTFASPKYDLISPAEVRDRMSQNPALSRWIQQLATYQYTETELDSDPNALAVLTQSELRQLRNAFESRFLLLPSEFRLGESVGRTFGTATYRLYDLNSGSLIYKRSRDLNVNVPGKPGRLLMSATLIGEASSDFRKTFLNR